MTGDLYRVANGSNAGPAENQSVDFERLWFRNIRGQPVRRGHDVPAENRGITRGRASWRGRSRDWPRGIAGAAASTSGRDDSRAAQSLGVARGAGLAADRRLHSAGTDHRILPAGRHSAWLTCKYWWLVFNILPPCMLTNSSVYCLLPTFRSDSRTVEPRNG